MPKTTKNLSKNLEKLTTKTSTKSTTDISKKPRKKPSGNTTNKKKTGSQSKKKQSEIIKVMNSRKLDYFPHIETFPIFLHDLSENKRCWFTCVEHAQKYVDRYKPKYKCYCYTGGGR